MNIKSKNDIGGKIKKLFEGYIGRIIGFIFTLFFNISFFIAINFFSKYIPFVTDDISRWIIFANVSIFMSIVVQFMLIFVRGNLYRMPVEIIQDTASLFSVTGLRIIYPFNFDDQNWIEWLRNINISNRIDEKFLAVNVDFWVKFTLICLMIIICMVIMIKVVKFIVVLIKLISE